MIRLISDENFHGDVVRGLFLRRPQLDLIRVQDVGLNQIPDPELLEWAASNDRIVLTLDKSTMPEYAYERIIRGEPMPGVFVADRMTVRDIIEEIIVIDTASDHRELADRAWYLPLQLLSLLHYPSNLGSEDHLRYSSAREYRVFQPQIAMMH